MKLLVYEMEQHKPWFGDAGSKLLDYRKEGKLRWLKNPDHLNEERLI
jgi:hypothetical protein